MTTPAEGVVFWIAKGADGVVRGGIAGPSAWGLILTAGGWERVAGTDEPPMPPEDAREAFGELCWHAAAAGLHGDDSERVPGPWLLEMSLRALMPH